MPHPVSTLARALRHRRIAIATAIGVAVVVAACTPVASPRPAARDDLAEVPEAVDLTSDEVRSEPWTFGGYEGELVTTPTHLLHLTLNPGRLRDALPMFAAASLDHYRTMITGDVRPDEIETGLERTGNGTTPADRLDSVLEDEPDRISPFAGPLPVPTERLSSFVFETRPEWAAWTKWRLGRSAGTYLAIERGGYTIDAESVLWDIGRYDTLCMLAHEGWHQYTQTVFRHPLPAFLEEGLATYAEGHRLRRSEGVVRFNPWQNFERFGQLRSSARRDRLIDLDTLVSEPPQRFVGSGERSLLTYYAQVWALIHYLVEGREGRYRDGLVRLLHDAAHGHIATTLYDADRSAGRRGRLLGPNAGRVIIAVYFDKDYAAFKAGYEDFLGKVTASGNGTRIWQGRSPLDAD